MKSKTAKVGNVYPVLLIKEPKQQSLVIKQVKDNEFIVKGHTIFVDMGGNWVSNPPINNPFLKSKINDYITKNFKL